MLAKPEPRAKAKRRKRLAAERAWRRVRTEVCERDFDCCRVCGRIVRFLDEDDMLIDFGHVHHIVYRSLGGKDTKRNLVLLCMGCHANEHDKRLVLSGTADDLTIERRR